MPSAAARWRGALGKVPPAPAKHDAGRASPIAQIVVWPSPGSSAASAFRGFVCSQLAFAVVVFWLTSFLQIFCLLLFRSLSSNNHVRSRRRRRRHHQGQPCKFQFSRINLSLWGFPVRGGRESRVRDLQSTGTESQSEAGGRRELWYRPALPSLVRTGPVPAVLPSFLRVENGRWSGRRRVGWHISS